MTVDTAPTGDAEGPDAGPGVTGAPARRVDGADRWWP